MHFYKILMTICSIYIADIGTGYPPCIALRADIDALPLQEMVEFEYKSKTDGMMHACGHDANAAMLIGAARALNHFKDQINGTVRLVWQPGEEGGGGGKTMVEDGAFSKFPPVENSFGMHVMSWYETGKIVSNKGSVTAAATEHHKAIDPVVAGAAFVRAMYDMYARERYFQHEHAGLVSICYFHTSSMATNVIADDVTVGGTLRAMKTKTLETMERRMKEIATSVAETYRCGVEFNRTMRVTYPNTENDPELFNLLKESFKDFSPNGVGTWQPMMGGEDYSFMTQAAPGCFVAIGSGSGHEVPGNPRTNYDHHTNKFHVDKRVLPMGAAAFAHMAFQDLEMINARREQEGYKDDYHDEF